jgi:hypothetical protein
VDFEPYRFEADQGPGIRRLHRLTAVYDGHTHIYTYPDAETDRAVGMVKLHVEEGLLHPYAGLMLVTMMRRSDER